MPFTPTAFFDEKTTNIATSQKTVPVEKWIRVNEHECTFELRHFYKVSLNLIQNPNINSSLLFRADILYDSHQNELVNAEPSEGTAEELRDWDQKVNVHLDGFQIIRRIIRRLVPRNPQLDRPVAQTCLILESEEQSAPKEAIVLLIPHVSRIEDLPWYHPAVKAVAYWYKSPVLEPNKGNGPSTLEPPSQGEISVHYQLFPDQQLPLDKRLLRTALHLLEVLHKHGQGSLNGYQKQGKHDQLILQKRVQDTYTELKRKHANRLCSAWVEQTEPSKHVFEDLGIAAYLIELWKDMYAAPDTKSSRADPNLPPFPGFVDIGCGNGVLTEVLILSGYAGEGFDGRRRKTWSILSPKAQAHLHETLCVPQPLFDLYPSSPTRSKLSILSRARALLQPSERASASSLEPPQKPWHAGLFRNGTFIISNHADELTPWTPLLACLAASPFLAIPCCSHNLSGARFRAPSTTNAYTADAAAPSYFNAQKPKAPTKSIQILIPTQLEDDCENRQDLDIGDQPVDDGKPENHRSQAAETGDLRALAPAQRSKQLSAYASLCDWVSYIAEAAGYVVERDHLRIPSTRNVGLVGRAWAVGGPLEMQGRRPHGQPTSDIQQHDAIIGDGEIRNEARGKDGTTQPHSVPIAGAIDTPDAAAVRKELVRRIVKAEGADGVAWVQRCNEVLAKGGGVIHGRE